MGWNWPDTNCYIDVEEDDVQAAPDFARAESGAARPAVLIVEDAPEERLILTRSLTRRGFQVLAVSSVSEALDELAQSDAPRILLVDWMMPEVSGLELVKALRRRSEPDNTYCIMTSSVSEEISVRRAWDAGIDDYLVKPLGINKVVDCISLAERLLKFTGTPTGASAQDADCVALQSMEGFETLRTGTHDHPYWW